MFFLVFKAEGDTAKYGLYFVWRVRRASLKKKMISKGTAKSRQCGDEVRFPFFLKLNTFTTASYSRD